MVRENSHTTIASWVCSSRFAWRRSASSVRFALSDVVIGLERTDRLPRLVPLQRPPARHGHTRAISPGVDEFPLPTARAEQRCGDLFERRREDRVQQLVSDLADRLIPLPAVQLLGATIPVGDDVVHVADEDRVMRQVEETGLLAQRRFTGLDFLERLAHSRDQAGDHKGRRREDNQCDRVNLTDGQVEERQRKEVVEADDGDDGHDERCSQVCRPQGCEDDDEEIQKGGRRSVSLKQKPDEGHHSQRHAPKRGIGR